MSDNLQNQELKQERIQQIMQSETRVAVNMDKTKEGYNADYYSMERTIEDNAFINRILQESDTQVIELSEEQRTHFINVNSRNVSHILLNQQKFSGDSKIMKRVKDSVEAVEKKLRTQARGNTNDPISYK